MYWRAGQVLHRYLPPGGDRAVNAHLLARLSQDLELSRSLLYEMLHFYRAFPLQRDLEQMLGDLSWTHCRALLAVPSDDARQYYARQSQENTWSARQLNEHIKTRAFTRQPPPALRQVTQTLAKGPPLQAKRGILHSYRLVPPPEGLPRMAEPLIDLGFNIHLPATGLGTDMPADLAPTSRYACTRTPTGFSLLQVDDARARHYTYVGLVESIIDGDTVWAYIDCGFDVWARHKLRLRGIDTPEIGTARGLRARDFVQGELRQVDFVVLTTTRPDKYGRYLTDLFYLPDEYDPEVVLRQGHFLNRDLLNAGLAKRMTD